MNSISMSFYLRKFWKENTFAIFFLVILCGFQVGANLLMMRSFQGIIDRNMRQFIFWMLFLVIIWFLIYGLTGMETFFRCRAIRVMNNAIRQDIAEILLKKSYRSFHEQSVGEYLAQFTNDISQIENMAWNPFFDLIRSAVTVVFSIAALLMLHWSLLAASLVTTVIMLSFPKLFHRQMEHLGSVCTREQSAAVSRLKELLSGYNVLRFFNQEQRFTNEAGQASDQIEKPKFRMAYVKGFANAGMGCVNIVCQMLHVALIGILSVRGIILQGALTGGGNLCGNLSAGLGSMVQDVLSMSSVKPYFEKISVHMRKSDEDQRETEASNAEMQIEIMQNEIMMDNVSFGYDKKTVLWGFTACFKKGGKYALTGPSGCGKSTLLKLMLGCLPEYTGSIRLDDRELRGCRPEQLWQQISYIEQDVFLFNSTIRDNITLGREFTREQIQKALQDSALDRENADRIEKNLLSKPELTLILVSHHLSDEQKKQFTQVFAL